MEQRKRLRCCFQDNRSVSAYVHELEELFNLIGMVSEREQVIKLWDGLCMSIQQSLWRDHYNPKISSWNEVVSQAEMIEIAENITSSRNNRSQRLEATNRSISNQPRAPETRNQFTRGHTPLRNCDRFNRTSQ